MDDKDLFCPVNLIPGGPVQIPLWTIRTPGVRFKIVAYAKVQIPLWTIRTGIICLVLNLFQFCSDSSMDDKDI